MVDWMVVDAGASLRGWDFSCCVGVNERALALDKITATEAFVSGEGIAYVVSSHY
jgi:hypothetical protein